MLHGAPDILIKKSVHISNSVVNDYSSLSSDDEYALENCVQRSTVKDDGSGLPEKLGEVLLASQFLLVCKIIRKLNG